MIACSDPPSAAPDAAIDASIDAATADAPEVTGPVRVVVTTARGAPVPGLPTIFQRADSSVVATVATDDNGVAMANVPAGSYVTVVERGITASYRLTTWAGVQPDDTYQLLAAASPPPRPFDLTIQHAVQAGATAYQLITSCGTRDLRANPSTIALDECPAEVDMLLAAYDESNGVVATMFAPDRAVVDDGSIELAEPFAAPRTFTIDVTNAPEGSLARGSHATRTPRGELFRASDVRAVEQGSVQFVLSAADAPALQVVDVGIAPAPSTITQHDFLAWGAPTATFELDVGATALAALATRPTYDAATHTIEWTRASGQAGELVHARYHTYRSAPDRTWDWRIATRIGADARIVFPDLPPVDGIDLTTEPTDSYDVRALTVAASTIGIDALRAVVFGKPLDIVAGPTGTAVFASFAEPSL